MSSGKRKGTETVDSLTHFYQAHSSREKREQKGITTLQASITIPFLIHAMITRHSRPGISDLHPKQKPTDYSKSEENSDLYGPQKSY